MIQLVIDIRSWNICDCMELAPNIQINEIDMDIYRVQRRYVYKFYIWIFVKVYISSNHYVFELIDQVYPFRFVQ